MSTKFPLSPLMVPPKSKDMSCSSCKLFQYSPTFTREDRENYKCRLDPERKNKKNTSFCMSAGDDSNDEPCDVLVLMDYPATSEDQTGEAFSGPNARIIRRNATEVGIDHSNWRWEYLLRCAPDKDASINARDAIACSRFLSKVIRKTTPKTIIAFGQLPLAALLGKTDIMINHYVTVPQNVTVAGVDTVVYAMHAPWYILRNDYLSGKYLEQFDKLAGYLRGESAFQVREDLSKYGIITDPDEAIALCEKMLGFAKDGRVIDMDTETSGLNPYKVGARLSVVSMAASTKRGYAIMLNHNDVPWTEKQRRHVIEQGLRPLMTYRDVKLRFQNGKFDYQWFPVHCGFWPRDIYQDTMLSHYAFDENEVHGLKPLALMFTDMGDYDEVLDKVLKQQTFPDAPRYDLVEVPIIGRYAAQDPVATRKLAVAFKPLIEEQGEAVKALAYRMMPALSASLTRMEATGVKVDVDFTKNVIIPTLNKEASEHLDKIVNDPVVLRFIRDHENAARAKMKRPKPIEVKRYFEFSLDSPKQLQTLIYGEKYFNHECKVFTDKGGMSTDKEALKDLAAAGSTIANLILEYRVADKLVNTFGVPITRMIEEQGSDIIHCQFKPTGTATGRLSSASPNLQQISGKIGGVIKRMFPSRYGSEGVFIQVDFSQIELRVLAALSGDPTMINVYQTGGDIHTTNACMIFGITEEHMKTLPKDEQKRMRTVAKRLGFGICYGIGGPGIQSTLKSDGVIVTEEEAQGYLDTFLAKYPKIADFLDKINSDTADNAYALSPFGRRRRLEAVRSAVNSVRARALRQAGNHVVQSGAADLTNTSVVLLDQEICLRRGDDPHLILPTVERREFPVDHRWKQVHLNLQVHDMIGADAHISVAGDVVDSILNTMQNVVSLAPLVWGDWVAKSLKKLNRVPIVAEAEVGLNWRDSYKVKSGADVPAAMAVSRAKMAALDADIHFKWTEEHEKAALANFKKVA